MKRCIFTFMRYAKENTALQICWNSEVPVSRTRRQHDNAAIYTEKISALPVSLYGSDVAIRACVPCGNARYTSVTILGLRITEYWPDFSLVLPCSPLHFTQAENMKTVIRVDKSASLRSHSITRTYDIVVKSAWKVQRKCSSNLEYSSE